jgi:hypothetical protein
VGEKRGTMNSWEGFGKSITKLTCASSSKMNDVMFAKYFRCKPATEKLKEHARTWRDEHKRNRRNTLVAPSEQQKPKCASANKPFDAWVGCYLWSDTHWLGVRTQVHAHQSIRSVDFPWIHWMTDNNGWIEHLTLLRYIKMAKGLAPVRCLAPPNHLRSRR